MLAAGVLLSSAAGSNAASTEREVVLPPDAEHAEAALAASPRHGEWVEIEVASQTGPPLTTWVVYPERAEKAGAVIVIHEVYGLTDWVRAVADRLAAEGFIALAPDLLSGFGPDGGGTESLGDRVREAIGALRPEEAVQRLDAVREYALALPAANGRVGTVGFCWGGSTSFDYATEQRELDAAVVYYGTSPQEPYDYRRIEAPVLGLYGEDDARVNATIPLAREQMEDLGKPYTVHVCEGAGHGFLRQQDGCDGANLRAAERAWPATLEFFREHLEKGDRMSEHASGTFDVELTPQAAEQASDEAGVGGMQIAKEFHGDLEGTSSGRMLTVFTEVEGSAGYVAMERVEGTLGGRSGTFFLQHSGLMDRGAPRLTIHVVPDSGTGELEGLAGQMTIEIDQGEHRYELEYTLPETS